ncbi:MAG: hypothetical protein ACFFDT_20450, partial [Candidatus Hodarchaeota archaeon]
RRVAKKVEEIQRVILREIENGKFAKEWENNESRLKLQIMRYFETNTKFVTIEQRVRENLNCKKISIEKEPKFPSEDMINRYPQLKEEIESTKAFYEGL